MTFRLKFLLPLLLLALLPACSSTTFFYNRLDFLIPWYMGKYVDLDRAQKQLLDRELQPFLAWHRGEELPTYGAILENIDRTLDGQVTADQVAAIAEEFEAAWLRTEARALEWMMVLGAELSDEQMAEFLANLREQQAEYEEEYLARSDEEYTEDAYENLLDSAQDYLGRLDWGQRSILEEAAARLQRSDAIWLRERAAWLGRMESILQRDEDWQQALRDALDQRDTTNSADYVGVYEHNSSVVFAALAALVNSRSDRQDRKLRGKLDGFRDDLDTLIARGNE
jgi:hypothetical protein